MTDRTSSVLRRYAVPPVAVTAAGLFLLLVPPIHVPVIAYLLLLVVVAACAFVGGIRAGLLATACSLVAVAVLAVEPLRLADPALPTFALAGVTLTLLVGARVHAERERDSLRQAVAIERERLEAVLDSAHIGIGFLDADLRFLEVNEALAEMNGVPVRDHLGRHVDDVVPWLAERAVPILRAVLDGEASIGVELANALSGSQERHFVASYLPLRGAGGAVVGIGFTVNDVTLIKRGELERERLLVQAEDAQRAADAANHMKDDFLITLSHELRSPLQGILGWARLLRGDQLDAKRAEAALETIERIVRQQAELLNGLFDVSRIMAGKLEIERGRLDLSELVRQAFEDKQFSARTHGIVMSCDAAAALPVLADAERIHQILANLLGNAIKFTPAGGCVEVRCTAEAGKGVISVRDTGEGIPHEFLPHLFERFAQGDRSQARRHGGLGLGLAIVRHLVELHGGSVAAESPGPGRGTTMTVRLPLAPAVAEPVVAAVDRLAHARAGLSGVHVLLVDDDADVRESTAIFLEMHAARVTVAASAGIAFDAFVRATPDVVITDLGLPGEDGYVLLQRLRTHAAGSGVPVIAFSGYASASERVRCLEAGFATHLTKPVDPAILMETLAAVVSHGPGAP